MPAVSTMSAAALPDRHAWQGLFSLSTKGSDDQAVLEAQLRHWSQNNGGIDAGLYSGGDSGWMLEVSVGSTRFPQRLSEDAAVPLPRLELPGALLLFTGSAQVLGLAEDTELLLLAAGARIRRLKQHVREQHFQANFRGVELEALYDVGLAIASTLDLDELGEEVLLRAVALLDARRGALYLLEEKGDYHLARAIGGEAAPRLVASEPALARMLEGEGAGPAGMMPGVAHLLAVPIEIEGRPRGVLAVADKESRRGVGPFQPTDRRTLALFANQAAIALENAKLHKLALEKERLEREMELAAEIQQQLLPKAMPLVPGWELVGWNRPARQVGGDYYDLRACADGHVCLVVGDVSGKGMPAALLVSTLHSALRLLQDRMELGPVLVERLNRHIFESSSANKFITMLIADLDPTSAQLSCLNAGHNPGLLVRQDGRVELLKSQGLPLGLLARTNYGTETIAIAPGDLLCLYSDGITECESRAEEEFGLERLERLLLEHRQKPLTALISTLEQTITDFAQGQPQSDDQTVVLLRRA
ncbi:MAG: SpoIIE family protein phosphatase [Thermoanaerobaculia bacterium]|nr:SpoIIE family protein phosphatase [Thermoanaerobaculia bacterium]